MLLVPLYLKYIPVEIYGGWLATGNIIAWLTIIDPGLSDVLRQQVGEVYGKKEMVRLNDLLGGGTLLSFIISMLVLLIGLISKDYVIGLLNLNDVNDLTILEMAYILAVIGSSLMIFSFGFASFNQGLLSSLGIGIVYVIATITSLIINILLLIYGYGIYSIPISTIISAIILITGNLAYIIWRYNSDSIKFRFSIKGFSILLKLSSYNILGRLGNILTTQIDLILVARFIGVDIVPILNLTRKGPELARMIVERPIIAMQPAITNAWNSYEYDIVRYYLSKLINIMLWLLGLLFCGFVILNKAFVTLWVGETFYAGNLINVFIIANIILHIIVNIATKTTFTLGHIKWTGNVLFVQSLITSLALFIGVKYFGFLGLVSGYTISLAIFSAWYFPYRTIKLIKFNSHFRTNVFKELLKVVSISFSVILIFKMLKDVHGLYYFIIYGIVVVLSYSILLFISSRLFRNELLLLLGKVPKQPLKV